MEEQLTTTLASKSKTLKECIERDKIVWFKTSDNKINCGRIDDDYLSNHDTVYIFNFDAWSHWSVSIKNIVRIGTSYYSEEYIKGI